MEGREKKQVRKDNKVTGKVEANESDRKQKRCAKLEENGPRKDRDQCSDRLGRGREAREEGGGGGMWTEKKAV